MRRTMLVLLTGLLFTCGTLTSRAADSGVLTFQTAYKIMNGVPLTLVLDLLDEITRRESAESRARLRGLLPQLKLRVHSASLDVSVERKETIWRGTTTVKLTMPADVEYLVDLDEWRADHVKWDKARRLLKIRLPEVKIGSVVPRFEEEKVETISDWTRPSWYRGGRAATLESKLRQEDYRPAATREAEKRLDDARRSARDQVRDLLRRFWLPHGSDVEIVVE